MVGENLKSEFCYLRDKIIEKRYEHLDDMQRKAVLRGNNSCVIVACPGAGKTTVLVHRVDYLCSFGPVYNTDYVPDFLKTEDIRAMREYVENMALGKTSVITDKIEQLIKGSAVNAQNIIVITFTKAAAMNMKKRYKTLFKNKGEPFFGTFHGLFYKILKNYKSNIAIIEAYESYRLIKKVLEAYMDEINEDKLKEVINDISMFKNSRLSMEEFEPVLEKTIFAECFKAYEQYKAQKKLMDFDDLQLQCLELFRKNNKILQGYSNLFKYMLVDEFQDSDMLQIELLKLLNNNNSIYAVGDEDQSIYSFRGSRPECMVDFPKIFGSGEKIYLSTNYRSVRNIIDISKKLIKNNVLRNEKNILSNRIEDGTLTIINNVNENSQAEEISSNIIKKKSVTDFKYSDFAILYRTNVECRSLIDNFIRKNIPFKLLDKEYNFFEHFICKDILSYLRLAIDKTDLESFLRIINKPFRYIGKLNLEKLRKYKFQENIFEVLKNFDDLPIYQMKTIDKLEKEIGKLNKMSLNAAIQYIIADLGYVDYLAEYASKYKLDFSELMEIAEEFKKAAEDYKSIITLFAHVQQVSEKLKNNAKDKNNDGVIFSTIHGVKGMEFKNVFIINCCEENIPHKSSMENNLEEERRLFYVGITRAIDNLFLSITREIRGKEKTPSRFIAECGFKLKDTFNGDYKPGDRVKHTSFGNGKVIFLDANIMEIEFSNGMRRKFDMVVLGNNGLIKKID